MVSDVKVSRRERYAALTCQAVLDAAKTLFVTNGFDATSVDEIARKAQASKGAVYHHFPDKQAIFTELFRSSQQAIIAKVAEAMPADSDEPWDKMRTAMQAVSAQLCRRPRSAGIAAPGGQRLGLESSARAQRAADAAVPAHHARRPDR